MVLSTKLTRLLGIRHPIIQGGMHYVGYAPLAAAVSEAGGIGLVRCTSTACTCLTNHRQVTALTQPSPEALQQVRDRRVILFSTANVGIPEVYLSYRKSAE